MVTIVPIYAGILALIYLYLTIRVVMARQGARIAIGMGSDIQFSRIVRVHGNFSEYAPFILFLLALLELQRVWPGLIHTIGILLIFSRVIHAYGVSKVKENLKFRITGMLITMLLLLLTGLLNIYFALIVPMIAGAAGTP